MYGPTTGALLAEGAIALLHDYRSGHALDLSGNGNHGTLSAGCRFTGPASALTFPATTDEVTVADAASLRLTAGSIIAVSERGFTSQVTEGLCGKRDALTSNYSFYMMAGLVVFAAGGSFRNIATSVFGARSLGVSFTHGKTPIGYKDGLSIGNFSGVVNVVAGTEAVEIGNIINLNRNRSPLSAVLLANRILTPTEMAAVHAELLAARWPSKQHGSATAPSAGADYRCQFKTDWGYNVSPADEGGVTGQQIGGNASPFRAGDATGRWAVETDTIDGRTTKAMTCKTAGLMRVPWSFLHQATPTEAAFGTFDWYARKADASVMDVNIIATVSTGITTGYGVKWAADESVVLTEYGVGNVVGGGTASHSVWHRFRVTRSLAGLFTLYIDGAAIGTGTDTTVTTATHLVIDMDAGDKIALGDTVGDHCVSKMQGVVAP